MREQLLTVSAATIDRILTGARAAALRARSWRGNLVELKATIESAVLRAGSGVLEPEDFQP